MNERNPNRPGARGMFRSVPMWAIWVLFVLAYPLLLVVGAGRGVREGHRDWWAEAVMLRRWK